MSKANARTSKSLPSPPEGYSVEQRKTMSVPPNKATTSKTVWTPAYQKQPLYPSSTPDGAESMRAKNARKEKRV